MPAKGEDGQEASRVFYVAATRATQRLGIGVGGDGGVGMRLSMKSRIRLQVDGHASQKVSRQ